MREHVRVVGGPWDRERARNLAAWLWECEGSSVEEGELGRLGLDRGDGRYVQPSPSLPSSDGERGSLLQAVPRLCDFNIARRVCGRLSLVYRRAGVDAMEVSSSWLHGDEVVDAAFRLVASQWGRFDQVPSVSHESDAVSSRSAHVAARDLVSHAPADLPFHASFDVASQASFVFASHAPLPSGLLAKPDGDSGHAPGGWLALSTSTLCEGCLVLSGTAALFRDCSTPRLTASVTSLSSQAESTAAALSGVKFSMMSRPDSANERVGMGPLPYWKPGEGMPLCFVPGLMDIEYREWRRDERRSDLRGESLRVSVRRLRAVLSSGACTFLGRYVE